MPYNRIFAISVAVAIASIALLSCNDKGSDYERTDLYQITQLLMTDDVTTTIYPGIWIDTTSRGHVTKATTPTGTITPDDYWVEVLGHKRAVLTAEDSCKADDFNQSDPCANIQIEGDGRAHVRNAKIRDSLACRYHIINAVDHSVTTKDVTFAGNMFAMMAKLSGDGAAYKGWSLYAVGAQWQHVAKSSSQPVIDSVVLKWADQRYVSYANPSRHRYVPLQKLPHIPRGEFIDIEVYTPGNNPSLTAQDAYIHFSVNGVMKHDRMDTYGDGVFTYDALDENSGGTVGECSQIVIEVFDPQTLQDTNANLFGNVIWAVSYRIQ